jgi:hypothetical protein
MNYTQFAFTVSEMAAARNVSWSAAVETDQSGRHWSASIGAWSACAADPVRTLAALTHAIGLPAVAADISGGDDSSE